MSSTKNFLILSETERRSIRGDRTIRRVFYNYVPVTFFYDDDLVSKKLAAIQLVNIGLAKVDPMSRPIFTFFKLHFNKIFPSLSWQSSAILSG